MRFAMKIWRSANPLKFPSVMPCSQQHPIGFIVLREVIRNGGICRRQVQPLHASVNHRMVQCVRVAAKTFTDFTRIVFGAAKSSCRCTACTASPPSVRFCTPVLRTSRRFRADFTRCREMLHGVHKQKRFFIGNGIINEVFGGNLCRKNTHR